LFIALIGDLGAGKTTFAQGFFRRLGLRRRAISPTFVIMRHYRIVGPKRRNGGFTEVYHVDAYRLKKDEDAAVLGLDHLLAAAENIVLVEWPERIRGVLPKRAIRVRFAYGNSENERIIKIL
jgi:tRNA threonylcarbamoyladenosine biosynthesis protein TsaE